MLREACHTQPSVGPWQGEANMSDIEEVASAAKSLEPADRLRLIARLWASLPSDHWAAPTSAERDRLRRHLTQVDVDLLDEVPWKIV